MSIFDIPLYYISFKPSKDIENHYKEYGFRNVNHFRAVDGRKLSIRKMVDDGIITIRSQDDLKYGRFEKSGMSSLGAIGCTLSHYELWMKCLERGYPYIIIAEEDNRMYGSPSSEDVKFIKEAIIQPNGVFTTANIRIRGKNKTKIKFFGTHFYIASIGACGNLIKQAFPISVQTDWYMADMASRNYINIRNKHISDQKRAYPFATTIQDMCITCFFPRNPIYYIIFFAIIIYGIFRKRKCQI